MLLLELQTSSAQGRVREERAGGRRPDGLTDTVMGRGCKSVRACARARVCVCVEMLA